MSGGIANVVLLLLAVVVLGHSRARDAGASGLNGDAALLRLAAVEHQANRQRLRTWSAQVTIDTEKKSGDQLSIKTTTSVDFVYSHAHGIRWEWKERWNENKRNGVEKELPQGVAGAGATSTATGATYYRPALSGTEMPPNQQVLVFPSPGNPSAPAGITRDRFDPMYFFRHGSTDVAERLLFYHDRAKNEDLDYVFVDRKGSRVTLELREPTAVNRYVVDLDCGANLVLYFASEHSEMVVGAEEWKFEYERVEGVWVPN